MPTISLCMIVKNEEMNLARCLDSVADLVEEIIIVDTGSKDRTVEIASHYTTKVYSHPWKDDFSDIAPMPEIIPFPKQLWTTVCGWMLTIFWKRGKRTNFLS